MEAYWIFRFTSLELMAKQITRDQYNNNICNSLNGMKMVTSKMY